MKSSLAKFTAVLALMCGTALAQDPKEPPIDATIPDRLKELKKIVSDRKMAADFQAITWMRDLAKEPEKRNPKDIEKLAKGIGDVFFAGKLREGAMDVLYREAAEALAGFGEDGAKELAKAVEHKRFKDNLGLRANLMLALGRTEDEKQIDYLLEVTTRSPHDELRAASGEALGNFTKAKIQAKREIVKDVIRAWGSLHSKATQAVQSDPSAPIDYGPQNARATLRAAEGKWVASLQKLTGVSHSKFEDWQRWLNKNPDWAPQQ